jgi:hypothetical protein
MKPIFTHMLLPSLLPGGCATIMLSSHSISAPAMPIASRIGH